MKYTHLLVILLIISMDTTKEFRITGPRVKDTITEATGDFLSYIWNHIIAGDIDWNAVAELATATVANSVYNTVSPMAGGLAMVGAYGYCEWHND